jgi:hypothetical protein
VLFPGGGPAGGVQLWALAEKCKPNIKESPSVATKVLLFKNDINTYKMTNNKLFCLL